MRLWQRLLDRVSSRLAKVDGWISQHRLTLLDLAGYVLVILGVSMWSPALAVILMGVAILLLSFTLRRIEQRQGTPKS
jgi:hypothetical protein